MEYFIPISIFAALGLLAGILLTVASKVFAVKTDDRIEKISQVLPQANCGACGFSGCSDYANAIVKSSAECNMCKPGGTDCAQKIAQIMGKENVDVIPEIAFLRCQGDCNVTTHKYDFEGVNSCAACNKFYNGSKNCTSGCLGYGDCATICPENAISIVNRIAHIDPDKCVGCGLCKKTCPNNLIVVRRKSQKVDIACSSADLGKITRKICSAGCIGCGLCAKACPKQAIKIENNHAVINYDLCTNCSACIKACKMNVISKL